MGTVSLAVISVNTTFYTCKNRITNEIYTLCMYHVAYHVYIIYSTYKHIKHKAIKMRRNVILHAIRNVIHTKSIYFVSNTILT